MYFNACFITEEAQFVLLDKTVKSSEIESNMLKLIQFFERKYDKGRSARS